MSYINSEGKVHSSTAPACSFPETFYPEGVSRFCMVVNKQAGSRITLPSHFLKGEA